MSKPSNDAVGTIIVPMEDFNLWLQTYYLKPPPGTFVSWGKVKTKGTSELQVSYATSTTEQPEAPPDAATQPVLPSP